MDNSRLLIGKKKRRGARNETNTLPLQIENTSKPLVRMDVKSVVDLYEVYREEYAVCQRYRITLTIKPYCTNVLYNVCTEIVKDEGSQKCIPVSDAQPVSSTSNPEPYEVYGKTSGLYRNYMVTNTEYSSPEKPLGYTYLPGYDIFNNHTLRSLSFRPVLPYLNIPESERKNFNTLRDYLRTKEGNVITFLPRFSKSDIENNTRIKMHMYEHSNVLSFIDGSSSEVNLMVENGWYGFVNSTSLTDKNDSKTNINSEHEFSRTLNNVENCGFVDMFPDRTRYSFVPKYNSFRQRYEKNWDVFLTYPWRNFYEHNIVKNVKIFGTNDNADNDVNALAIMRVWRTKTSSNRETMLFRTFTKHGLTLNDKVAIYLSTNSGKTYNRLPREYTVDYLGDSDGNNTEHFFGITTKTLLNDVFAGKMGVFYNQGGSSPSYGVSHEITDVPTVSGSTVLTVYYYETASSLPEYDSNATFDNMPKTVNPLYPTYPDIRVWNKGYTYMSWDENAGEYVETVYNPEVEYGDWNTFTDVPDEQVKEQIRVKTYDYYSVAQKNYTQRSGEIDDLINGFIDRPLWQWRFVKVVNNIDCQYYIREFKKLPNFKFSEEPLPDGVSSNVDKLNDFLSRNATDDDGNMLEFDSETYRLAFSKTLYGDDVAQVTFLDNIDITNLTDNLGRPVTEIYSTIVKRNKGYRTWYDNMGGETDRLSNGDEVEYSRCFGSLTTGFEYLDADDVYDRESRTRELKGYMSSVTSIYRDSNDEALGLQPFSVEDWDSSREAKEITETDDVFYGDVVEYNPVRCTETVLSDACFRFNTAQREIGRDGEYEDFDFSYDELLYDDYDPTDENRTKPFLVRTYKKWLRQNEVADEFELVVDEEHDLTVRRKEGYYYKPHTRIPLLRYSENVEQGSHRTLRIGDCRPIQSDAIYIKVATMTMHGVGFNTVLYLCDGENWSQMTVSEVFDNYSFAMVPPSKDDVERNGVPYVNWIDICEGVRDGSMKLRVQNEKIPYYASRVGENLFMWRNVINPAELSDLDSYRHPFSNNAFYVDAVANVFLRRQDPDGINGLYVGKGGDIEGKVLPTPNNKYKTEMEIKCY